MEATKVHLLVKFSLMKSVDLKKTPTTKKTLFCLVVFYINIHHFTEIFLLMLAFFWILAHSCGYVE